jgi:hypothetical protein
VSRQRAIERDRSFKASAFFIAATIIEASRRNVAAAGDLREM